jgi:hypothetical protein
MLPANLAGSARVGQIDPTHQARRLQPLRYGDGERVAIVVLAMDGPRCICRQDLSATFQAGIDPHAEVRDALNRPLPLSGGSVIEGILGSVLINIALQIQGPAS